MGGINISKVLLGGLLAGLVINIGEYVLNDLILGERWDAVTQARNLPPMEGSIIVWFIIWAFVMGIGLIGLYACIRPRCGPGPKTAICAGLSVWFFTWLMGFGITGITEIYPWDIVLWTLIWGIFELPLAAVVGAWPYSE